MKNEPPVIVLAFANDPQNTAGGYLRQLPVEINGLKAIFDRAQDAGLCAVEILTNTTIGQLIETFQKPKYRGRIAVFHYSGHANSFDLLLEDEKNSPQQAHSEGLLPFLAAQPGLQLVFLNGCFSWQQASELSLLGMPVVIGTVKAVNDAVAPVLQIVLSKMWQMQAGQPNPVFRLEEYETLQQSGILLSDFFAAQMAQIHAWEAEISQQVERSGLALDVLNYHTTVLGTAESRNLDELRRLYQHQSDVLNDLVHKFQELYLLTDVDGGRPWWPWPPSWSLFSGNAPNTSGGKWRSVMRTMKAACRWRRTRPWACKK